MTSQNECCLRALGPARSAPVRVVFFPHAGGSARAFVPLARHLGSCARVFAVQYPGHADRAAEPLRSTVAELADEAAAAVFDALADGPFALFGHSMGALVAFEVARRLAGCDAPSHVLFASAHSGPRSTVAPVVGDDTRPDSDLLGDTARLGGFHPELLRDPAFRAYIAPVLRTDLTACRRHSSPDEATLSAPIRVFLGRDDPAVAGAARRWAKRTSAESSVTLFPGGHFYFAQRPQEVACEIRRYLTPIIA